MAEETHAGTTVAHDAPHAEATFLGLGAETFVYISVALFFALVLYKGAHKAIFSALDARIQKVKDQLAEAASLRAEAEQLKADAVAKQAEAEKTAADIVAHAKTEAAQIITDAGINAEAMMARRSKMAEDKIAAAERAASDDVRATAASLATAAAHKLLKDKLDPAGQSNLVDQAIGELDRRLH
jgi:F-type H+-transporting ATPase subunit b